MALSNFPNGFSGGISLRGLPVAMTHPGEVFYVNGSSVLAKGGASGSNGNVGTYQQPFATIDYAIGKCTAGRGDIIMVMPGHTETITTDGGIACDVAGIAIIGLGTGSLRPTITLDSAAAAAVTVSAANVTMRNLLFVASFADITNAIDVTAANFALLDCEFKEEAADLNFLDIVHCSSTTDNNADGLIIDGCRVTAIDASMNSLINIKADLDGLICTNNFVNIDAAVNIAMILCATGKDLTDCEVTHNIHLTVSTSGDLLIDNDTTANTGVVAHNLIGHLDTAGEVIIDCDGVRQFENYATASDTASGYLLPAADS